MARAKPLRPSTPASAIVSLLEQATERIEALYLSDVTAEEQRTLAAARGEVQEVLLRMRFYAAKGGR